MTNVVVRVKKISNIERELHEWLKLVYFGEIIFNDRKILNGPELDIFLPNLNIAIEFNGDYWHSEQMIMKNHGVSSIKRHGIKSRKAQELEITLLYVWECQWNHNNDLIKKLLLDAINGIMVHPLLQSLTVETLKNSYF